MWNVKHGFVQVPVLIMEARARSLWCGSFRYVGISVQAPILSWHGSFSRTCSSFRPRDYLYQGFSKRHRLELLVNLWRGLWTGAASLRKLAKTPRWKPMCFPLMRRALSVKSCVTFGWALKCIVCVANGFLMLFMHTARGKAQTQMDIRAGALCVCSNSFVSHPHPGGGPALPHSSQSSGIGCFLSCLIWL